MNKKEWKSYVELFAHINGLVAVVAVSDELDSIEVDSIPSFKQNLL